MRFAHRDFNNINIIVLLFLSLSGCAKKGPPPSPDRLSPFLLAIKATDRNHIEVKFDELLQPPETLIIEGLSVLVYITSKKSIFISTDDMNPSRYKTIIKNLSDLSGNKNTYEVEFNGTLIKDTIPPATERTPKDLKNLPQDTTISIKFTEWIEDCFIYIMPKVNTDYRWKNTEIEIDIIGLDTANIYNFYGSFWDKAENKKEIRFSLTRKRNIPLLWVKGKTEKRSLLILTKEKTPLQFAVSDSLFTFQKIQSGDYNIFGRSKDRYLSSNEFTISIPRENIKLYPVSRNSIEENFCETIDSLWVLLNK